MLFLINSPVRNITPVVHYSCPYVHVGGFSFCVTLSTIVNISWLPGRAAGIRAVQPLIDKPVGVQVAIDKTGRPQSELECVNITM